MESLVLVVGISLTKLTPSTYEPTWLLITKQQRQGKVDGGVGSDCVEHLACKEWVHIQRVSIWSSKLNAKNSLHNMVLA